MGSATIVPQTVTAVPVRYIYPVSEQTLNKTNYTAAAAKIGGDLATTRLFWDQPQDYSGMSDLKTMIPVIKL